MVKFKLVFAENALKLNQLKSNAPTSCPFVCPCMGPNSTTKRCSKAKNGVTFLRAGVIFSSKDLGLSLQLRLCNSSEMVTHAVTPYVSTEQADFSS